MEFVSATSLGEALEIKASRPDALPVAGGTDVMVGVNFGRLRPPALLDLTRAPGLTVVERTPTTVRIGAGVTYTRLMAELGDVLPGLAAAARTVGSPQIRNRGTIGGNLGTASPAGDCHPVLLATDAAVEVASVRGTRSIPANDFFLGPKRNALEPDELITAVLLPPAPGPQIFAKVGTRNAMVIAVCSLALELRPDGTAGAAIGSAGPVPLRATEAESFLAVAFGDMPGELPEPVVRRFGQLVAAAARPIDDVRGTADYRRHALAVLARRTLTWAWQSRRTEWSGMGKWSGLGRRVGG
jgi:CO/xanthine dehydrogenase FAD-binding subunit